MRRADAIRVQTHDRGGPPGPSQVLRDQLEVLDWGGRGRALVLLAGSGNTAHVCDEFAPRLTDCCHVYGITRRGLGASSRPSSGYDDQRLADDLFRAVEAAKIDKSVASSARDGVANRLRDRNVRQRRRGALRVDMGRTDGLTASLFVHNPDHARRYSW
jgi:hypothetical protein